MTTLTLFFLLDLNKIWFNKLKIGSKIIIIIINKKKKRWGEKIIRENIAS